MASPKNPNCVSCVWTFVRLCVSDYDTGVESRARANLPQPRAQPCHILAV